VGILGGSFSPPHRGHVEAAEAALDAGAVDVVLVVPAFAHAFGKGLFPFGHRLAMARIAFASLGSRVVVSDLERHLPRPSYTVSTLRALIAAYSTRVRWRLVMGSDVAAELPMWREPEALVQLAPPLVFNRAGDHPQLPADDPRVMAGGRRILSPASSTKIRQALFEGDLSRLNQLVPESVLRYLTVHRLIPQTIPS
jgi:nicotinate-nucleotide adenylyltransferase